MDSRTLKALWWELVNFAAAFRERPSPDADDLKQFIHGLVLLSWLGDEKWVALGEEGFELEMRDDDAPVFRLQARATQDGVSELLYQSAPYTQYDPEMIIGDAYPERGVMTDWFKGFVVKVTAGDSSRLGGIERQRAMSCAITVYHQLATAAADMLSAAIPEFKRWKEVRDSMHAAQNILNDLYSFIPCLEAVYDSTAKTYATADVRCWELVSAFTETKVGDLSFCWDANGCFIQTPTGL